MQGSAGGFWDIVVLVMAAFGLTSAGVDVVGGLCLGLAGAFGASRILSTGMVPHAKPLGVWGTVLNGIFVAIIAGILSENLMTGWPVQLAMGLGAFSSSFVAPFVLKMFAHASNRAPDIVDRGLNKFLPKDD